MSRTNRRVLLGLTTALAAVSSIVLAQYPSSNSQNDDSQRQSTARPSQPIEVGTVRWQRDFDAALAESGRTQKPVFVLFQEVPGCKGCRSFGKNVLADPLLVEAIENEFIPVLVYNNRAAGPDHELLKRYREPAWNYQVIRFLDESGVDIIPRKDKVWTTSALASRMCEALRRANRTVPKYLTTLAMNDPRNTALVAFAMSCFWTGEFQLGNIDGVVATEAGWLDGREVTLLKYNPELISLTQLAERAANVRCAQKMYTPESTALGRLAAGKLDSSYRMASAGDQKRQLRKSPQLANLPNLNETQLARLNALVPRDLNAALQWLSPSQRRQLDGQ
jgi:hypothetical protein